MTGRLFALLAAICWGFDFIALILGMKHLEPFAFNGLRFFLGALFLVPVLLYFRSEINISLKSLKPLFLAIILMSSSLFIATALQQFGLQTASATDGGFISGLYIIFVPMLGILINQKVSNNTWFGASISVIGLFFLSAKYDLSLNIGDTLILISAIFWALNILITDHFVKYHSALLLAFCQFFFCGLISLSLSLFLENSYDANKIYLAGGALLYSGIFSVALGFTLQVMAQKSVSPSHVAIILSIEAVFAATGGWYLLNESLTAIQMSGCSLMLGGIILSQIKKPILNILKPSNSANSK
ncbi:DMT family transporter [Shewanella sp. 202IG2-18]|nr:DMT family transporter [Parashewanella hymeniacidonis]MBM7073989.1 DMT family transporter [Parashewanella hymeniacidonis]